MHGIENGVNNKYDFVLSMHILNSYKKQHNYITARVLYFRFQLSELYQYNYVTNDINACFFFKKPERIDLNGSHTDFTDKTKSAIPNYSERYFNDLTFTFSF